ncbi:MAG: hypothetical protein JXQ99_15740 [Hyphomicrobiaceae bacterium]
MRRVCFDSSGRLYEQAQLQHENGAALFGDAFAEYAACNLGYVSCARHANHARLWVRPTHVSNDALTEAVYYLVQECPSRVALHVFQGAWATAIMPVGQAVSLLCEYSRLGEAQADYERTDITELPPCFQGLVNLWQALSGSYQPEKYLKLASEQLDDRLFVVERHVDHLRYQYFGSGIGRRTFAKEVAEGAPVECFSDTAYALRTAVSYHDAFEKADQPSLERIFTRLRSQQSPEAYLDYVRLLLPCKSPNGNALLVGTSVMQSMVH